MSRECLETKENGTWTGYTITQAGHTRQGSEKFPKHLLENESKCFLSAACMHPCMYQVILYYNHGTLYSPDRRANCTPNFPRIMHIVLQVKHWYDMYALNECIEYITTDIVQTAYLISSYRSRCRLCRQGARRRQDLYYQKACLRDWGPSRVVEYGVCVGDVASTLLGWQSTRHTYIPAPIETSRVVQRLTECEDYWPACRAPVSERFATFHIQVPLLYWRIYVLQCMSNVDLLLF